MAISPRLVAIIESLGLRIVPVEPTEEMLEAGFLDGLQVAISASPFAPEN